ncbi:MAG: TonB-dependent receptor, partial [Saprospiraceae bacterium]|nr:TonB-dependent receptor [Saprospiraceae bacterium]
MKYLLLAIMFCIGINMNAQNKVFGTLQNENGEALIGASVFLQESQFATITDDTGFFELQSIPRDTYDFKITFLGYKSYTESIVVDGDIKMDIVLDGVVFNLDKIEILANELDQNSPFVYSEMGKEEISFENLGQDLPFLLEQTPSVVVTSDAGAGIGYTGMRVRGSDPTRVNVTINGVPLNDSESHGLFWVNLPDFASSVDKVQIQRGVGPSTNGAGAFGATVSLNSNYIYQNPYIHISGSYGSFNSQKISASFGTGLIADKYNIEGRYSRIVSDGYIDRASSNLNSFYFSASKVEENKSIRFNVFSGKERTYQSWNGIPEAKLEEDDEALMAHYLRNPGMYQT